MLAAFAPATSEAECNKQAVYELNGLELNDLDLGASGFAPMGATGEQESEIIIMMRLNWCLN